MVETAILLKDNFKVTEQTLKTFNNKDNLIVSLDYESHKQLEDLKIKHVNFENYLNEKDFKIIDDVTFKINTSWYKNKKIQDILTFDKINFGWLLEQELFLFLLATITDFTSLIKIRNEEKNLKKIIVSSVLLDMAKTIFSDF